MKTILLGKPSAPVVLSAKSWYQNAYPKKALSNQKISSLDSNGVDLSQLVSPDWNAPVTYTRFDADVIEMPVAAGSGLAVTQNGETNPAKRNSRSWLLLLQKFGKYMPIS